MSGSIKKVAFELLVGRSVDADAGVPFGFATTLRCDRAATVRNGVALELDRMTPAVTDLVSLLLLEVMIAFCTKKQVPSSESDVLHVCEAATFAVRLGSLADVDAVFCDEFPV